MSISLAKPCEECGLSFEFVAPWDKFCSERCADKHRRKLRLLRDPEAVRSGMRRRRRLYRARQASAVGSHTEEEWRAVCREYGGRCLRCGTAEVPLSRDHVVPLVLGGTDYIENIQPLCQLCNSWKGIKAIDYRGGGLVAERYHGPERRLTMREAAELLGTTKDAVRMRVRRGTLRSEKDESGTVYVWISPPETAQAVHPEPQDQGGQSPAPLLDALKDEITHLRRESERKDAIIMSLSQSNAELSRTIRAIEAPGEPSPGSASGSESPQERTEGGSRTSDAPDQGETLRTDPSARPWWRRIFDV